MISLSEFESQIDFAKAYLDLGWSLIPIIPETKKPPIKWGEFQARRAGISEVEEWINKNWYLAVVTGDISGILIVDDDRVKNGLNEWGFDSPVVAKTQSNGKHYYFKYDREIHSHTNTQLHIDLKAWHSYCLLPPFKGRVWVRNPSDNLSKLQSIPDETVRLINSDMKQHDGTREPLNMADFVNIPEGARTDSLYRIACSIFNKFPKDEAIRVLAGVNQTYKPPLNNSEFNYQISKACEFVEKNPKVSHFVNKYKKISKQKNFKTTDTGNAEWIASLYGDKVRFDHRRKRWLIWQGHRWQPDIDQEINRYAIESARQRYLKASDINDSERKTKAAKWAISSESRTKLDSATSILKSILPIADPGDNWDLDNMLLSCPNGILDLKTNLLRNGRPEDRITMVAGTIFDPEAKCPRWKQFVNEVFEGNTELVHYVHKAVGYSITGEMREQVVFFCFGPGSNGKSVFFKTISAVLNDYAYDAPVSLLQRSYIGSNNTNDLASIEFKRFLVSSETLSTSKLNEQRIKGLTGGDRVTARYLYSEFFTFEPTCKPWLFINHKPLVDDDSYGFWRRVKMIPFNRTFKPEEQDKNLVVSLKKEYPGILNWMLEGCLLWQKEGLSPAPEIVNIATQSYREENDELSEFVADKCIEKGNAKASELFKVYQEWAEKDQGLKGKDIMSKTAFGRRMTDKYSKAHHRKGWFYKGISLIGDGFEQFSEAGDELDLNLYKPSMLLSPSDNSQKARVNPTPEANYLTNPSPDSRCPVCNGTDFWTRPDGGKVCSNCHPPVDKENL